MKEAITGFNSQRQDALSGTYHLGNGYRDYNPLLMRFHSPDSWSPFGAGGINSYAYCAGDPINRADPSGHFSWQTGLGIGLGILGIVGALFTDGGSLAVAGSLEAALGGASPLSLLCGGSGLLADISGIASGALSSVNPRVANILGWASFAAGIVSCGIALYTGVNAAISKGNQLAKAFSKGLSPLKPANLEELQQTIKTLEGKSLYNPRLAHTAYFTAQQWGVEDLDSVFSVVQALDYDSGRVSAEGKLQRLYGTRPEDIFLIRDSEQQFLDMDNKLIFNNKQSVARVMKWHPERGLSESGAAFGSEIKASTLPDGGISFFVSTTSGYMEHGYGGNIQIMSRLSDVFALKGNILADTTAALPGAVFVEMPQGVGLPWVELRP